MSASLVMKSIWTARMPKRRLKSVSARLGTEFDIADSNVMDRACQKLMSKTADQRDKAILICISWSNGCHNVTDPRALRDGDWIEDPFSSFNIYLAISGSMRADLLRPPVRPQHSRTELPVCLP